MKFKIVTKEMKKAIKWLGEHGFENVHPARKGADTISADFTGNETAADVRETIQKVPGFQKHFWIS